MKKTFTTLLFLLPALFAWATQHTINTAGISYSPSAINVLVGDTVTIAASANHPLVEVSEATWNTNGSTPLPGGFGTQTSSFTFVVSGSNDIFFVCSNHVGAGMKGRIFVSATNVALLTINDLIIGPNPVTDGIIQISNAHIFNGELLLTIFDVQGRLVYNQKISSVAKQQIEVSLEKGNYVYYFSLNGLKSTARQFVVAR